MRRTHFVGYLSAHLILFAFGLGCSAASPTGDSTEDGQESGDPLEEGGDGSLQGSGGTAESGTGGVPGGPVGAGGSGSGGLLASGGLSAAGGTSTGGDGNGVGSGGTSATGGNGTGGTPAADCSGGVEGRDIGDKARDFTVTDADGGTHTLSNYCGRVVVLEVSSPECGKCARNAAALPEFAANYSVDDVVFMTAVYEWTSPSGQNNGTIPTPEQVNSFIQNTPLTPSFHDTSMWDRFSFTGGGTPSLVIIGKDQIIKYFGGGESHQDYKPALDAAIAE